MSESAKVAVKFTASHGVYVRGDIAGFEPAFAAALIKAGVATDNLEADLGGTAAVAPDAGLVTALAEKDARIAALEAQLEAAQKGGKAGKTDAAKTDAGTGAPPQQGAAG
ncbi:hypothetical protein [Paragemmobacter ruber]|uniref:Mu-like prophage FluMu N-terminal domain-containing protein n=1 Tax=Paragemmobacter ruber TaxID=1985673 RepID=A0ABW9Y0B5_9RHOB|nr:hypothetical protein [Rhodobacter ruber]NBE05935.1 hypothetical protein [Rhodobacter ruber]